ncbi:hypothetical protein O3G_MSEX009243 [Manduca sexta]|nr:hypothetical protein O3G_MSEX009243 [Manduca sexta]
MAQSHFALSWDAHRKNICNGLSTLQQNGEFVDMTLAADGHFVKVHQVIVALASPFIKELLASAPCPHPVLFLNKISYTTLCALLEYIYTGEVYVAVEDLIELSEAAKELHIKGLEDIKLPESITSQQSGDMEHVQTVEENDCNMETLDEDICYFEISNPKMKIEKPFDESNESITETPQHLINQTMDEAYEDSQGGVEERSNRINSVGGKADVVPSGENSNVTVMQYTVSNQGSLQMILNRYIYYLKHTNRNNSQQWRCVDYLNNVKCPAHVITKNGVVVLR